MLRLLLIAALVVLTRAESTGADPEYKCPDDWDCQHGGTCNEGVCACPGEWRGYFCELMPGESCLDDRYCYNGGTCNTETKQCYCTEGWSGPHCQESTLPPPSCYDCEGGEESACGYGPGDGMMPMPCPQGTRSCQTVYWYNEEGRRHYKRGCSPDEWCMDSEDCYGGRGGHCRKCCHGNGCNRDRISGASSHMLSVSALMVAGFTMILMIVM